MQIFTVSVLNYVVASCQVNNVIIGLKIFKSVSLLVNLCFFNSVVLFRHFVLDIFCCI